MGTLQVIFSLIEIVLGFSLWKGLNFCVSFNHEDLEYIKFKVNKVMWSELFIKPKSHPQLSMKIKPIFAQYIEKNNDNLTQMSSSLVLQKI